MREGPTGFQNIKVLILSIINYIYLLLKKPSLYWDGSYKSFLNQEYKMGEHFQYRIILFSKDN